MFILAVAKNGTVDVITYSVEITGPPQPPQPPQPGTEVSEQVAALTASLPKPEKIKLADNFDRIAAMGLTDASVWIYETSKSNRDLLGQKVPVFEPFFKELGVILGKLAEDDKLTTPEDHIRVWKEIAVGLRKG
jgi:hypothetical protein